jgi:hypothetical protein
VVDFYSVFILFVEINISSHINDLFACRISRVISYVSVCFFWCREAVM